MSLDSKANRTNVISEAERATRERIGAGKKVCSVCREPYEFSLRVIMGKGDEPNSCEHDGTWKAPKTAMKNELARIESDLQKEEVRVRNLTHR